MNKNTLSVYVLIILLGGISCLKIVGVAVPTFADLRQPATLVCSYDTEQDSLFSVKWYKDDREFFRYMPSNMPSVTTFPLAGAFEVQAEEGSCSQTRCGIKLAKLTPAASGSYICEVSAEAPSFRTVMEAKNMTVAALPLEKPRIEGLHSTYDIGDTLDISCRTAPSAPPSTPKFFINDVQIEEAYLNRSNIIDQSDMIISVADLRLVLSKGHFLGGALLRIQCSAAVTKYPAMSHSTIVTAALADTQTLRNQRLKWSNGSGQLGRSLCLVIPHVMYGWRFFTRLFTKLIRR